MRKLMLYSLLSFVALAPALIVAIPGERESRPMFSYYFIDNIQDKQHQIGEVMYWSEYRLEDQTYIGTDSDGWTGHVTSESSLINYISNAIAGGIGGQAGWSFGGWLGNWIAGQVAIEASWAAYALGLGAMSGGPWVGLVVGASISAL